MWTNSNHSFTVAFLDELQKKTGIKICHITLNLLLHYLAKIESSTVQIFTHTSQNNVGYISDFLFFLRQRLTQALADNFKLVLRT